MRGALDPVLGQPSLQFLGDAGNVASRLEAATKALKCVSIISEAVFELAETPIPEGLAREELAVRGLDDHVAARLLRERGEADFGEFPPLTEIDDGLTQIVSGTPPAPCRRRGSKG